MGRFLGCVDIQLFAGRHRRDAESLRFSVSEFKAISWYICAEMKEILTALMIPLAGTVVGAGFVFLLKKEISAWMQKLMLGFAAGAMLYVVVEELIPETSKGSHSNLGTVGFAVGFALMMVLDVVLG